LVGWFRGGWGGRENVQSVCQSDSQSGSEARYAVANAKSSDARTHVQRSLEAENHMAFLRPRCQFSRMSPAIVRPFPTPAPSPTKKPV
jgi:hypothetical protein